MTRLATFLPLLLAGCFFSELTAPIIVGSTSDWYEVGTVSQSRKEVHDTVVAEMRRQGFTVTALDSNRLWIESEWRVFLGSHWRTGFRTKVQAELEQLSPSAIGLQVRAVREINNNAKNPLIESQARWVSAGVDDKQKARIPEPAIKLNTALKLKFFGLNNG